MRAAVLSALLLAAGGCRREPEPVPEVPVEPIQAALDAGTTTASQVEVPVGPPREVEPNDRRDTASPLPVNGAVLGTLAAPTTVEGAVGVDDVDTYALILETPGAQAVRVQLTPEDHSDLILEWVSPTAPPPPPAPEEPQKGKRKRPRPPPAPADVLGSIDNAGPGAVEILSPVALQPGRHLFRVRARAAKVTRGKPLQAVPLRDRPYRLSSTVVDLEPSMEQEPNDKAQVAGLLRPGETRQGYVGWAKDLDWYKLDLANVAPGSFLKVAATGVPDVKLRLLLADKNKATLTKVPEARARADAGAAVAITDFGVVPGAQPYYVAVDALKGASPAERYQLTLTVEPPADDREVEPNWKTGMATRLPQDRPTRGHLSHAFDWDVYRLDSPEAVTATTTVTGVPGVDVVLELIHDGRVISTINEGAAGAPETLPLIRVGPEAAYVRVSSKDEGWSSEQSYTIAAEYSVVGTGELEPNNDFSDVQGSTIAVGQQLGGNVFPRGDVDLYAFEVRSEGVEGTPPALRSLTIEVEGVEELTLRLELLDAARTLITKQAGVTAQEPKSITHDFPPGRYFVRVREESGQGADAERGYTLRLVEGPPAPAANVPPPTE